MAKKKGKYKKNPMRGLLVVNPSKSRKYKKNPRWGAKKVFSGMFDKSMPLQMAGLGGGAAISRIATAKILKDKDVGFTSLGVQSGVGLVGGLAIKTFLKQVTLGKFFFMGSVFHAAWRFVSTKLSKNLVAGFEYGDVYLAAPAAAAPAETPGTVGLYLDEGETIQDEDYDLNMEGVGNVAYESAY